MNRKLTEKKAHMIVQQLKQNGASFPVSLSEIIDLLPNNPVHVIRELAQKGYIANPELYEGPLPVGTAQRLENLGVFDRATFREMLEAGRLNLENISYVGRKRRETILKWARLNPEDNFKCAIRLKLPVQIVRHLREFANSKEYSSTQDVVRSLVDEVLAATGWQAQSIKQKVADPMRTAQVP
jgi:hypothetical protein